MQVFPEPLPDAYERAVAEAVGRIKRGSLRKVVLARTIRVEAGRTLDPRDVLKHLRAVEPDGYSFAVDTGMGRTLVGASPELLISRVGDEIRANPLAGSAPRAGDPEEDRENAERLGSPPRTGRSMRSSSRTCSERCTRSAGTSRTTGSRNSWPRRTCGISRPGSVGR